MITPELAWPGHIPCPGRHSTLGAEKGTLRTSQRKAVCGHDRDTPWVLTGKRSTRGEARRVREGSPETREDERRSLLSPGSGSCSQPPLAGHQGQGGACPASPEFYAFRCPLMTVSLGQPQGSLRLHPSACQGPAEVRSGKEMVVLLPRRPGRPGHRRRSLAEPGPRAYSLRPGKPPGRLIMGFIKREDQ